MRVGYAGFMDYIRNCLASQMTEYQPSTLRTYLSLLAAF